jgi:uroporphyrinogen-III synthase
MSGHSTLDGRGIVVTRPAHQAAALAALISAQGGRPILFPMMDILDVEERGALNAIIDRLDRYDLAIFVSPNAVGKGMQAIRSRRSLPPALKIAAVGRASARELQRLGVAHVLAPEQSADSEALLALPQLGRVAGQRIAIFRGVGGRELLRDTLVSKGAAVDYAECYRRVRPQTDLAPLLTSWRAGDIDAIVVTSSEGLRNFHEMLDHEGRECLARTPVFVPHPRIAETARELGLTDTVVTGAGDDGIAASLVEYFSHR